MKDSSKPAAEDEKKQEEKKAEEPSDQFYGKYWRENHRLSTLTNFCVLSTHL